MRVLFLAALAFVAVPLFAGCDSADPSAAADATAGASGRAVAARTAAPDVTPGDDASRLSCPSSLVGIAGIDNATASTYSSTFTASMKPGCVISSVSWSISPSTAGTLSASGTSVTVSGINGGFTLTANVVYDVDNVSSGTKTVTYGPANIIVATSTSTSITPIQVTWTNPANTYAVQVVRSVKIGGVTTSSIVANGSPTMTSYTDNTYRYVATGPYTLTYTITAINSAYQTIGNGSAVTKGDTLA